MSNNLEYIERVKKIKSNIIKFDEKYKDLAFDDTIKEKEKVKMAISYAFAEIVRKNKKFY